ncbi:vWA domain-containing protein [Paenibacillus sp. WLX1005]|uniref:vWA domain-containing protein n=1 Tax=Paenibacillus sp. WLX1005 TaxID=3243766 RepID=UPI0039843C5A
MNKKIHYIIPALLFVALLSACTGNTTEQSKAASPSATTAPVATDSSLSAEETTTASVLPKTFDELAEYPAGPYADVTFADRQDEIVSHVKEQIPTLNQQATDVVLDQSFDQLVAMYMPAHEKPLQLADYKKVEFNAGGNAPAREFKQNFNVEIVLDASGSMSGKIGSKTKMDIAKQSIQKFASQLPAGTKVSLRVYGNQGTSNFKDKMESCKVTDQVYPFSEYDAAKLNTALDSFQPSGWTPLTLALTEAQQDLANYPADQNTNVIYLVSDGINTCDGDPVATAKEVANSDVQPILNVIGFDVDNKGQQQLKQIAKQSDGLYSDVNSEDELMAEFNKLQQIAKQWDSWKRQSQVASSNYQGWRNLDVNAYDAKWRNHDDDLRRNISATLDHLRDDGTITSEQYTYLVNKRTEYVNVLTQIRMDTVADIRKQLDQKVNDVNQDIDETYEQGPQDVNSSTP